MAAMLALCLLAGPARAEVRIEVGYSEAADLYSTMDNLSLWLNGYTWPEYREEWTARFGWSEQDEAWAARYTEYRRRTWLGGESLTDDGGPPRLFASAQENLAGADPLATYMMTQSNVDSALRSLEQFATPQDAAMLRGYYEHFRDRWEVLLGQPAALRLDAAALQNQLHAERMTDFLNRIATFYGVSIEGSFNVFLTRRPPGDHSTAEVLAGNTVLLHSPADIPAGRITDWDTIVMHELVHFLSSQQDQATKAVLSADFVEQCPVPNGLSPLWLLEEPLAVAIGQAAYSEMVLDQPLSHSENWYAVPYVNLISRTLAAPAVAALRNGETLDASFVAIAADRCRDVVQAADLMRPTAQ